MVPEAQDLIPLTNEKGTAQPIRVRLCGMLSTIQFDHQPICWTTKIRNERTDGVLAPKLCMVQLPGA